MSGIWWSQLDSLSGGSRNNPPKSFVKREAGYQQPDRSRRQKAGSLPELVPRFRVADPLKNSEKKERTTTPKPKGVFWQTADGDGSDPRRSNLP